MRERPFMEPGTFREPEQYPSIRKEDGDDTLGGGQQEHAAEVLDPEDAFFALLDSLSDEAQELPMCTKIADEAERTGNYEDALKKLQTFIAKRSAISQEQRIWIAERGKEVGREHAERMIDHIRELTKNKQRFLGKGATASVFTFRESAEDNARMVCVKVVSDLQQYKAGVSVEKEMRFLETVRDLHVEGVRAPVPQFAFQEGGFIGLAMEHLDAVSFERVMQGEETEGVKDILPEGFDLEDYFDSLRAYMTAMHAKGIYHNDVDLRNMMIDRATGKPRLIDFGRANYRHELEETPDRDPGREAKTEIEAVNSAERRARQWLESLKGA